MKVLLFSNDLMPFGNLPTSGGGLRCWQLKCGLEAHGIEVVSSMPGFTYLAEKYHNEIPLEQRELLWNWGKQDAIFQRVKPDAVLFASNWDHFNLTRTIDVPLIIDLHGSRLIETTMWQNPVSTDHKVRTLAKADCLLCAGKRQRLYFYGWLVQAGRVPEDDHFIRYIPISMDPRLPRHDHATYDDTNSPHFVSGGGWFPWQNQAETIFAACEAVVARNRGLVSIYGTPHQTQTESPEEREIRAIFAKVKGLAERSPRVKVHGYVGRQDLLNVYSRASVALEAMGYNLERELAFTTRTIEYLWCGLPVLYNNFSEISEHIGDYDAGWTVNPESRAEINAAIEQIFAQPAVLVQKSRNAQQLVADRFSWDKTILPLVDFLKHPRKMPAVQPVVGGVRSLPSFLSPRGFSVNVPIPADGAPLRQSFVIPADDIVRLEMAVVANAEEKAAGTVQIKVANKSGSTLVRRSLSVREAEDGAVVSLPFKLWRRPRGGDELTVEVRRTGGTSSNPSATIFVRGMCRANFPFISEAGKAFVGQSHKGEQLEAQTLAISFVPGYSPLSRVATLGRRAWIMLRSGQWRRLYYALMARVPARLRIV